MVRPYREVIRVVKDGEPVNARTTNSPTRQIDNNFRALRERLELLEAGKALFQFDVPCEPDVVVGQPVWFNSATMRYERALAGAEIEAGHERLTASTYVVGIVLSKNGEALCDLLTQGIAEVDISAAVDGDVEPGIYYLSGSAPGMLKQSSDAVGVPILLAFGDGNVQVRANLGDIFTRHVHLKKSLSCQPAGVPVLDGGFWEITDADEEELGWLPADHASFNDLAPEGAVFGYNLAADDLTQLWPPIPISSAYLEWDRGDGVGGTGIHPDLCVMDVNGIWWMSACEDDAPWQYGSGYTTTTTESGDCPVVGVMRMTLFFTRMVSDTGNALVRSIRSASDLLRFVCTGTDEDATDGDITAILDFTLAVDATPDDLSAYALKALLENGKLKAGPIVAGIKSGSSSLLVSGSIADVSGFSRGNVTLTVITQPVGAELSVDDVQLQGVQLEYPDQNVTLMFEAARNSSLVGKVNIPFGLDGLASVGIKLRAWVMGTTASTLPLLTLTKRVLARPTTPVDLPDNTDDAAVVFNSAVAVGVNQYVEIDSAEITLTPGSSMQFKLSRADDDSYAGDVHLLKLLAVIVTATEAEEE